MVRVRRARREGVREEPAFTFSMSGTGSNLTDTGRLRCVPGVFGRRATPTGFHHATGEAFGKDCGVPEAMPPEPSRAPTSPNGTQ